MTKKQNKTIDKERAIPRFASYEEEANFWDTHGIKDYWDTFEPVKLKVSKNLSRGITIRFDEETLQELREYAHKKGMGPTTLARMWILEQLESILHPHTHQGENCQ